MAHSTQYAHVLPLWEQIFAVCLVGDDIFPLKPWLMKPNPGNNLDEMQRIFNYTLSRARCTIEDAFGILAAKWRIFRGPIKANVALVKLITKASVCLRNYLRLIENPGYLPSGFIDCEQMMVPSFQEIGGGRLMGTPMLSRQKELVAAGTPLKRYRPGKNLRTTSITMVVYPGNMTTSEIALIPLFCN